MISDLKMLKKYWYLKCFVAKTGWPGHLNEAELDLFVSDVEAGHQVFHLGRIGREIYDASPVESSIQ